MSDDGSRDRLVEVDEEAPDLVLSGVDGDVALSSFWSRAPVVIAFLRHFGCPICRDHLRQLEASHSAFRERAAQVVAIGQGSGEDAQRVCAEVGAGFPCLGDPQRESYRRYSVPRGSWADVTWKPMLRHPIQGIRQTLRADLAAGAAASSDVVQLGGLVIVARGGRMRFRYRQRLSSDLPAIPEVLAALDRVIEQSGGAIA